MTVMPFQVFYLVSTLAILPFVWVKGGPPERAAVGWVLINYFVTGLTTEWIVNRVRLGVALADLVLLGVFIVLAVRHHRWWLLVAGAGQLLTVAAHVALWMTPSLTLRVNVATRWVFGVLVLYALLAGVLERRLAGERPVAPLWRSRSHLHPRAEKLT